MSISERLRPLDALRGIAAILIACILHWHDNMNRDFTWFLYGNLDGRVLVEFFFMISGLTFTAFYMKRIANNEVSVSDFIHSRFIRLVPLHWGTLVLVTCLLGIRAFFEIPPFVYRFNDVHHLILNLLMIQADGLQEDAGFNAVSWTICIEILMYIIFFMLCKKSKTKHRYFVFCWLCIILGFSLEKSSWNGNTFSFVCPEIGRGMIAFFVGSILYFALLKFYKCGNKVKIIAFLLLLTTIVIVGKEQVWCHGNWWYMITGFVFIIYPLVIYLSTSVSVIRKILMWKPLQYLGSISFTIYMCHYPVQLILDFINKVTGINASYTSYKVWLLYCALVIIFSMFVHRFYEIPVTNWLKRYKEKYWKEEKLAELS